MHFCGNREGAFPRGISAAGKGGTSRRKGAFIADIADHLRHRHPYFRAAVHYGEGGVYGANGGEMQRKKSSDFPAEQAAEAPAGISEKAGNQKGSVFVTRSGKPLDRSNIWSEMKRLCGVARVPKEKVFPHNLRHLFARVFYSMEKDIAKLADLLGHSSIETTRIYIMESGEAHRQKLERMRLVL